MNERSSRRGKSREQIATEARGEAKADGSASLSELRRRAAHRLREIGLSLEMVRRQYEEAAAECARLRAGGGPEPTGNGRRQTASDGDPPAAGDDRGALEELRVRAEELSGRLGEAARLLAAERAESEKLRERLDEVEGELAEARDAVEVEKRGSGAAREEADELRAELQHLRDEAAALSEGTSDGWRRRVVQLQIDLRRALADSGQLRDERAKLLRFLDELSDVFAAAIGPR